MGMACRFDNNFTIQPSRNYSIIGKFIIHQLFYHRMQQLFNGHRLSEYFKDIEEVLTNRLNSYDAEELNDVLIEEFLEEYTIIPLKLLSPQPGEPKEATRLRDTGYGEKYQHQGYEIKIELPFEGDWQLFDHRPNPYIQNYPNIDRILSRERKIIFTLFFDHLDKSLYEKKVETVKKEISANIPNINNEVSVWNGMLKNKITGLVEQRRAKLNHKHSFMKEIGLEINPVSSSHIVPPIKQKKIPTPVADTSKKRTSGEIPALQQAVYEDIIEVIYHAGKAIERKPSLYRDKGEEDIRDMLLLFLETRYESTTGTAETFNRKGKTDILLKYAEDGSNIFVAECKIWKGQKKYHEAIDQLLGYLTHRDSKTALIIFVDQKSFTAIVETVKQQTADHLQFKRHAENRYDTSYNYIFSLPDDSNKEIQVEVMLFHFPKV